MYRLLPFSHMMDSNITSFFFIILRNISGFIHYKKKSKVKDIFIRFKAIVENHFKTKIITLYSYNEGEYIGLQNLLATNDISHLTTPPYTPEHNGYSEKRHHHIVKTGLTLLSHASLPLIFWSQAFATTVYLINIMPTNSLGLSSPYKSIFGTALNYSKLKIFGCLLSLASTIFIS
jgi:hypothetical protein